MKILNFNSGFWPDKGGVAVYSHQLTKYLSEINEVEKVTVVAFNVSQIGREEVSDKYLIFRFGKSSLFGIGIRVFYYMFKFNDHQVVHATNFFPVGLLAMIGAKLLGKKFFITIYGTDTLSKKGSKKTVWLKKLVLKGADGIFSISQSTAARTIERYDLAADNIFVIKPGATKVFTKNINKNLRQELGLADDDFVVLVISHLVKRKGINEIIEAIKLIDDKKVKLLIVGYGPERDSLQELCRSIGVFERVIFAGKVDEVDSYYQASDISVLFSYYNQKEGDIEGFGMVLVEAQLRGVPVIGSRSGGIPEAVHDQVSGFIIDEHDINGLSQKILFLKNNPQVCQQMSQAAKKFALKYDWSKSALEHVTIYKKYL